MINKNRADGLCGICNSKVPDSNMNKFYCSESCRMAAWRHFHPDEDEPDWDSIPKMIIML